MAKQEKDTDREAEKFLKRNTLIRQIYARGNPQPDGVPAADPKREDAAAEAFFSGAFFREAFARDI